VFREYFLVAVGMMTLNKGFIKLIMALTLTVLARGGLIPSLIVFAAPEAVLLNALFVSTVVIIYAFVWLLELLSVIVNISPGVGILSGVAAWLADQPELPTKRVVEPAK
jgi:hypothetical protein